MIRPPGPSPLRAAIFALVMAVILLVACGDSEGGDENRATLRPPVADGADDSDGADGVATGDPGEASDGDDLSGLRPKVCSFDVALLPLPEPECGFIEVPSRRDGGGDVDVFRLDVARFPSTAEDPGEPLLYLEGGPGGDVMGSLSLGATYKVAPWLAHGDVIVFTQRGTGESEPSLECPRLGAAAQALGSQALDLGIERAALEEEYLACRDQLVELGADLEAYNSVESAHDIDDLRTVLGVEEWNILGLSYGTRLAQTLMREHPDGIRSVILDSVVPVEGSYLVDLGRSAERSFAELFTRCSADSSCAGRYPDLEERFFALADRLDVDPVQIDAVDVLSPTRDPIPQLVTGDDLVSFTFLALYDPALFTQIPQMVEELETGETTLLESLASLALASVDQFSTPMNLSVTCREEMPFVTQAEIDAVATDDRFGRLVAARPQSGPGAVAFCEQWGAGQADAVEEEPVSSDIPTLLLGGQFDPITPPSGMAEVAAGFSTSYQFTLGSASHGVISDPCGQAIISDFLQDPGSEPDGGCISAAPEPAFVFDAGQIAFETRTVDVGEGLTVDADIPVGWVELAAAPGAFGRNRSIADVTSMAVLVDSGGLDPDTLIGLVATGVGIDPDAGPDETRDVDGRTWDIYRGFAADPDQAIDAAVAEIDDLVVLVLFTTDPAERDVVAPVLLDNVLASIQPS